MSEIIKIFMIEELIKRREKFTLPGWNKNMPTKVHKFSDQNGFIKNTVIGGKDKSSPIIEIL